MKFDYTKAMSIVGVVGGFIATLCGGWTAGMQVLLILMIVDYICGLIVAGFFHKSKKTEGGGLESRAGWKGLMRKVMTMALVLVAAQVDQLIGNDFARDAVVIGFCANEALSIIENVGLAGIWVPSFLKKAIEVLKQKSDEGQKIDNPNQIKD